MSKDWHSGHFCCWQCDESLTGQRYVLRDDHPYCVRCYEQVFANSCEECGKQIGIDSKVSYSFIYNYIFFKTKLIIKSKRIIKKKLQIKNEFDLFKLIRLLHFPFLLLSF